jgi:lipoprotein-anchoring transpeptidase ErfK/SrfK
MRRAIGVGSAVFALASLGSAAAAGALGPAVRQAEVDGVKGRLSAAPPKPSYGPAGSHMRARVVRRTTLYRSPGGRPIVRIGHRTRFGGPQIVSVVERRRGWVGVLHQWAGNGMTGWIRSRDANVIESPYTISIDRSTRTARLRRWDDLLLRFRVTIGRAESPTPLGRFGVTDRLDMPPGSVYGCCAIALTARQTDLPQGWPGGDRVALHGSADDAVGGAASAGCLRVREADLRVLMRRVPVGTRVTVHH